MLDNRKSKERIFYLDYSLTRAYVQKNKNFRENWGVTPANNSALQKYRISSFVARKKGDRGDHRFFFFLLITDMLSVTLHRSHFRFFFVRFFLSLVQ